MPLTLKNKKNQLIGFFVKQLIYFLDIPLVVLFFNS